MQNMRGIDEIHGYKFMQSPNGYPTQFPTIT